MDKLKLDPYIYGFLVGVIKSKYNDKGLSESEIEQLAENAYQKFSGFLLMRFREVVQISDDQSQRLKSIYDAHAEKVELLQFLDTLAQENIASSLDKVLVGILDDFIAQFSAEL